MSNLALFIFILLLDTELVFLSASQRETFHFMFFLPVLLDSQAGDADGRSPGWLCLGWTQPTGCFCLTCSKGVRGVVLSS